MNDQIKELNEWVQPEKSKRKKKWIWATDTTVERKIH